LQVQRLESLVGHRVLVRGKGGVVHLTSRSSLCRLRFRHPERRFARLISRKAHSLGNAETTRRGPSRPRGPMGKA
jgi:hypothetical protein